TDAVTFDGPPLTLDSNQAQALGLVLHELLTNALKYGALGHAGGSLDVRWTTAAGARLEWVERSDSIVDLEASGFGTRLIETLVKRQLGGTLSRTVEEGRYRLVMEWPLKQVGV